MEWAYTTRVGRGSGACRWGFLLLAWILGVIFPGVTAAEPPRLDALRPVSDGWRLEWSGGTAPFQVERAETVSGPWSVVGQATPERTASVEGGAAARFFRVRETVDPGADAEAAFRTTLDGISAFLATVSRDDAAAWRSAVLGHLRSRGEVVASGENSDGVWAITAEGIPLVLWNNRPADPPGLDDVPGASPGLHGTELPNRTRARLSVTLGASGFTQSVPRLSRLLARAGYGVATDGAPLDSLKGEIASPVFFLNTHGGMFGIPLLKPDLTFETEANGDVKSVQAYALWTGTKVQPNRADATYNHTELLREVRAKRLAVANCPASFTRDASGALVSNEEWRFAITAEWVKAYLRFPAASHASVWLGACKSGAPEGAGMRAAFRAVGAEMVSGWTGDTTGAAVLAATSFLFDRLLGANEVAAPETPQRPFPYDEAWNELRSRGLHRHSVPGTPPTVTEMVYEGASGDGTFGLFAPSLAYVLVDEWLDQAHLVGWFGNPSPADRKVRIGGQERSVVSWEPRKVVVDLPRRGAGSAGDVEVEVRGIKSNVRRLSRWTLTGEFKFFEEDSNHVIEGTPALVFRADIGEYRQVPGNVFIRPTRAAVAAQSSEFPMEAKGTDSQPCGQGGTTTIRWTGGGPVPTAPVGRGAERYPFLAYAYFSINTIDQTGALGLTFGLVDPDQSPFKLVVNDCEAGVLTLPVVPASPGDFTEPPMFGSPLEERFPDGSAFEVPLPGKVVEVGADWTIQAGEMKNKLRASWRWNAAGVEFAPDPKAAR